MLNSSGLIVPGPGGGFGETEAAVEFSITAKSNNPATHLPPSGLEIARLTVTSYVKPDGTEVQPARRGLALTLPPGNEPAFLMMADAAAQFGSKIARAMRDAQAAKNGRAGLVLPPEGNG